MTESELILAAVWRLYPPRRWAVCDRVSWGFLPYEADCICISKGGTVHELEAKSYKGDLVRDEKKQKWTRYAPACDCFWYVVEEGLKELAVAIAKPKGLGVIVVTPPRDGDLVGYAKAVCVCRRRRERGSSAGSRYIDNGSDIRDRRNKIWRLASLRYWDEKTRALQAAAIRRG